MKARMGAALLVALLWVPATAHAQDATRPVGDDAPQVERQDPATQERPADAAERPIGPVASAPRFGDYAPRSELENEFDLAHDAAFVQPPTRASKALMIAGAALLVSGLIIGDDAGTLVAVTGAAIGAYGVYLYFE